MGSWIRKKKKTAVKKVTGRTGGIFEWLDHCIAVMEENVLILWKHMLKHLAAKEHSICTFSQFRKQYYVYAPTRFFFNIRALLKYDSHTTKFTLFKCTIQYFQYSYKVAHGSHYQEHCHHPQKKPHIYQQSLLVDFFKKH